MKKLIICLVCSTMMTLAIHAQGFGMPQKFSPEKFDTELQEFITKEAKLTQQEAATFFPVFREMQGKQRELFNRQKSLGRNKPQDEESCLKAIQERDAVELEMKRLLQTYHERFLDMLPASKVYDIIRAEDRFHRSMLKRWNNRFFMQPPHFGHSEKPKS